MTEFCGVLGQVHGNGRRYDGPFGKSDRAFFIGALAVWYAAVGSFHIAFYAPDVAGLRDIGLHLL